MKKLFLALVSGLFFTGIVVAQYSSKQVTAENCKCEKCGCEKCECAIKPEKKDAASK